MLARRPAVLLALAAFGMMGSCSEDEPDCDSLQHEAWQALDDTIQSSQGPCAADSDCTLIDHASACHDSCNAVALASSLAAIGAARADIDAHPCREFAKAGCMLVHPPCIPPGNAICQNGICVESD